MKKITAILIALHSFSASVTCASESVSDRRLIYYAAFDYLHWKAQEDQLNCAINIVGGFPKDGLIFAQNVSLVNQFFQAGPGFRALVGAEYEEKDALLAWTHLEKSVCCSVQGDTKGIFATAFFGFLDTGGLLASEVTSKWHLDFNTVDAQLAHTWFPLDALSFRPYLSVKWARIKQAQNIDYSGIESGFTISVERTNNFSGVGPCIGVDEKIYLFRCFNIVGSVSGALLYGEFEMSSRNKILVETDSLGPIVTECKKRLRPMAHILIGCTWEPTIGQGNLELGVAYEAQYWWSQWQMMPSAIALFANALPQGDLTMHGLNVRVGLRF